MSQPPPRDQGPPPDQGPPWPSGGADQAPSPSWPSGDRWPSWPSGDQPPSWPSAGQPQLSWPSGAAGQPQPSWPSGRAAPGPPRSSAGQPPLTDPGYGYGPRPRRFRRHPFRGVLIVLGFFAVLGVVVKAATGSHPVSTTTPFPSANGNLATGRQAPPGKAGSSFDLHDGGGNTYRVTLVKVIDPAQGAGQSDSPDSGRRFVSLVFRITALTGSPQNEDADTDAVLVGGNGQNYPADFSGIAGYTNFDSGIIRVAQGDTVTGAVAFEVPDGVAVSKVQWSALSGFGSMVEWDVAS